MDPLRLLGFPASINQAGGQAQYAGSEQAAYHQGQVNPQPNMQSNMQPMPVTEQRISEPVPQKQVEMSQEQLTCMVNAAKVSGSYAEWQDRVCSFDCMLVDPDLINQVLAGEHGLYRSIVKMAKQ